MIFWIIFGTASFTALVVSWGMTILLATNEYKKAEAKRKIGMCSECGAPLPIKVRKVKPKQGIGFKR